MNNNNTFAKSKVLYSNKSKLTTGIRTAFGLLAISVAIGVIGFVTVEGYSFLDAFYMTIITLSTVGFSEVRPLSGSGRIFTSIYILGNIGVYAYAATAFSRYIIEGEIFKKRFIKNMEKRINALHHHVIVCGFGKYGYEICRHLEGQGQAFIVIERDELEIEKAKMQFDNLLWLVGDATSDELLIAAGIERAKTIMAATGDDSENIFIVLTAKQLNKNIDVISRAVAKRSEKKMFLAGANHVIMPDQIGGFYMAVLVNKPDVVDFFSFIANETNTDIGFEEIHFNDFSKSMKGKMLKELNIRSYAGANVIGLRDTKGQYSANPGPDTILKAGESYIVIGNKKQITKLGECLSALE